MGVLRFEVVRVGFGGGKVWLIDGDEIIDGLEFFFFNVLYFCFVCRFYFAVHSIACSFRLRRFALTTEKNL